MTTTRGLLSLAASLYACVSTVQAATKTYDFEIGWTIANPDGAADRPVIGINGQWPIPTISVDVGDRVMVNVLNSLGNQTTSLHFHGLYQNGTSNMDGPPGVTQCEIPSGSNFTYDFVVNQPGTYWYHSHTMGQYPDGIRGPFIVNDPDMPYKDMYDEEYVLTVSDWYHEQFPILFKGFLTKNNPTGAEPVPDSALFNDTKDLKIDVTPGKTYLFRMINMGAFAGQYVWFEGHNITIVEVDGIYTQPAVADMIYLTTAQRYSFLLTARNDTSANFPFMASMDTDLFDAIPDGLDWNVTGWLNYNDAKAYPDAAVIDEFDPFDDWTLAPYDNMTLLGEPDQIIELNVIMDNLGDGANYAFFNNITYKAPAVPSLYTVLSSGNMSDQVAIYGEYTHPFVAEHNQVIQIELDNSDSGKHPFHLHGHNFQAVWRSDDDAGFFADSNVTSADFPAMPMRRDTFMVRPGGNIVMRFVADNPGVWLYHCHIEWHVASGLVATIVEAPQQLQESLTIQADHYAACAAAVRPTPTVGNAAGNTVNLLDLTGEPAPPAPLPAGFTTKGIVALVFSTLCGILGVVVVAWYGLSGPGKEGQEAADSHVVSEVAGGETEGVNGAAAEQEVSAVSGGSAARA